MTILNDEQIKNKAEEQGFCDEQEKLTIWELDLARVISKAQHDHMVSLGWKSPEQVKELLKQERERIKTELEQFFFLKMNTDANTKVTFYKENWIQCWQSLTGGE